MRAEAWFQYLMSALMALGLYVLTDISTELTHQGEVLTKHLIAHNKGLTERIIVLEQEVKATRRSEK